MDILLRNDETLLILFLSLSFLAFLSLLAAWFTGRRWGDLSSRRHFGEALTEEEMKTLRRSRRSFWVWAGISLVFLALSYLSLR